MDEVEVETLAEADLESPVLIEGLPGVGHVGKLTAEHIVEERDSTLVKRVYSEHFPPQVAVDDDGVATLASAEFHAVETEGRDLLALVGDYQASESIGHYRLASTFLDIATSFGVEEVIALGGVPTGELVEEYNVLGAITESAEKEEFETAGVEFRGNEPAGGIVGTSGLLLGLGEKRGVPATCLMGETSGYLVDPKSAQAVLTVLQDVLGFEVDFTQLEERAEEMEEAARELQEMQGGSGTPQQSSEENLRYFG